MKNKYIAKKYARALYNVAVQTDEVQDVSSRIKYLVNVIKTIPELKHLLQTHQISVQDKISILENVLSNSIKALEIELIKDIITHHSILILAEISKHFEYLIQIDSNIVEMTITSSTELNQTEIDRIKSKAEVKINKKINVKMNIDKSLIGGVKLRLGNTVIDNSISRQLNMLKSKLTQA